MSGARRRVYALLYVEKHDTLPSRGPRAPESDCFRRRRKPARAARSLLF